MEIKSTGIEELLEVIPQGDQDNQGWFPELFKTTSLKEFGRPGGFTQKVIRL